MAQARIRLHDKLVEIPFMHLIEKNRLMQLFEENSTSKEAGEVS